ncbi:MAG: hydrogenase 3 maturation endopeptidase HyCI [Spirochaetales bacterium]|nr:hydrogenase 3 maturation endopeptidase HyCI [Spirochaetales bacterium]
MTAIGKSIKSFIKGNALVVGIGNCLKGDDGAGSLLAQQLSTGGRIDCLDAGVSIENYLGTIVKKKPDTLLIIDAVDFGASPGTIRVFERPNFPVTHVSTHGMSLHFFFDMLHQEGVTNIILIGIQPERVTLGEGLSAPVQSALDELYEILIRLLA